MQGTITVANANSTPAFLRNLGFAMVCPLPVVVRPALGRLTQVESATADDGLGKGWIDELAADAAAFTPHGWVRAWTAATLRWRLASPITQFSIHRGTDGWAIATLTHHARIPFAIIVKLIPRAPHDTLDAAMLATAACRFHKAPFALYAGMNAHGSPRGIPLPRRALPSPLNLLVRSFDPALDRSLLQTIDTYEFLDADHY